VADTRNYVQGQDYFLSGSGITLSATSAVLTSMEYPDGTLIVMADFGTLGYITFEPETEKEENASFTGITQNANGTATITGLTRGLAFKTPYTADLALRQSHSGGSLARISNSAPFYNELTNKNNDETINNAWTFPSTEAARPQNNADTDTAILAALVTFGQLSRTSFAGVSDASTVSKGIVEIATQTEVNEGDDSGSTTAPVVVIPSTLLQTRDAAITTDFTYGATLTALAPVYVDTADSNKLKLALATAAATADTFVGITVDSGVDTDVNKRVQIAGIVTGLSGLTPGAIVFLTNAGGISSVAGTYRFPLGVAISATAMEMFPAPARRPLDLAGVNASVTSTFLNSLVVPKFGGTGTDGVLDTSAGVININLGSAEYVEKNYTSINIVTNNLTFTNPAAKGTLVVLRCSGDCTISATIVANFGAAGAAGGAGGVTVGQIGTDGSDASDSDEILDTVIHGGLGGDCGEVNSGGSGEAPITAAYTTTGVGRLYPISTEDLYRRMLHIVPAAGAGGGGGGCAGNVAGAGNFGAGGAGGAGGLGGGAFLLEVKGTINFTGTINATGAAGTNGAAGAIGVNAGGGGGGAGGGGAGGYVVVLYNTLTSVAGTVSVTGGASGAGGNAGGFSGVGTGSAGGGGGEGGAGGGSVQGTGGAGGSGSSGNGSANSATGGVSAAGGAEGSNGVTGNATTGVTSNGGGGAGGGAGGGGGGEALVAQNQWFY